MYGTHEPWQQDGEQLMKRMHLFQKRSQQRRTFNKRDESLLELTPECSFISKSIVHKPQLVPGYDNTIDEA